MNNWNGLDFFIFLIFAANTILGIVRGATREIISTMCLSVALIFAIKFTIPLATFFNRSPLITDVINSQFSQNLMWSIGAGPLTASLLYEIAYSISLLICFLGAFSVCEAMLSYTGFVEVFPFPYAAINRKLGGALGFLRGYIFNLVLISILALHLVKNNDVVDSNILTNSVFVKLLKPSATKLDSFVSEQQPERYHELLREKPAYNVEELYKDIKHEPAPNYYQPQNPPQQPGQPVTTPPSQSQSKGFSFDY